MIGYTLVGTNDLEKAKTFYDGLFAVIGAERMMEMDKMCAWGIDWSKPMFGVSKPYDGDEASAGNGAMIAIPLDERDLVDALHAKAIELGARDEGGPGVRGPEGDQAFYAAYFRDPDGNKLAAYRIGPAEPLAE